MEKTVFIKIAITIKTKDEFDNDDESFVDILDDIDYTVKPAAHHSDVSFISTEIVSYEFRNEKTGELYKP